MRGGCGVVWEYPQQGVATRAVGLDALLYPAMVVNCMAAVTGQMIGRVACRYAPAESSDVASGPRKIASELRGFFRLNV